MLGRPLSNRSVANCFALYALLMALLSGCSAPPTEPLRIGINAWPGYEFVYLAKVKDFYREAGVEVRIIEFNSLTDAMHAYERGQLDGLGCTIIELLIARAESARRPVAVYVTDYSYGADVILGGKDIQALADLKGKRIGLELGSVGVFMLARALDKAQLALSDVQLVSSDQLTMESRFSEGHLDAIVTYPPVSTRLEGNAAYRKLFSSAEIPGQVVDVLVFDEQVIAARGDDVRKVLRAFQRAQEYTLASPDDAYSIMAKREGISPAEFAAAVKQGIRLPAYGEQATLLAPNGSLVETLRRAEKVLLDVKQISKSATPESAVAASTL
jgi:NitT/TauT family transport system substrate-binding protein